MSGFRHRAQEVLREAFIVEGSRSQTRGRIAAGIMTFTPPVIGLLALVIYLLVS